MAAIERSSLPDQVFRTLAEAVLSGRFAPGERLPGQRALAAELGVNMASLREGIKRLEQLRLVEVRHGDAMRVTDWRAEGGLDVLVYAATADPEAVGALFEARRLLLREAARLAAERRSGDQAMLLLRLAQAFEEAGDRETAQGIDLAFFATVIESAGNLVFTLILNSIRALYLEQLDAFRPIVDVPAHHYVQAADAIAGREPDRAARAVDALAAAQEERMR
jgi:GntR family transcriptional regulator, transcriptional repressor for pyruvate dehydrogenase complex